LIHFAYCHPLHHLYPAYETGPLATSPIRNSFLRSRYFLRRVVGMGLPKRGRLKKTRARTTRGWISERGRLMSDNRLANATSPYLLQHKDNPVDWRPWGTEALEEAKALDKPILLSVGYAACHWCHVMAHESFEDPAVAAVMNQHFVNIKVDREERPDIDQIYMTALHALGQQGGWPLTMFLTPAGEPFWGGTYFPKEPRWGRPGFVDVLMAVHDIYRS